MPKSEKICFVVEGEFITNISRTLWADEFEMTKAMNILNCLEGMTEEIAIRILTGKAKLVGDSTIGVTLEPDNQGKTELGNSLSFAHIIKTLKFRAEKSDLECRCRYEYKNGLVKFRASPWGAIFLPECIDRKMTSKVSNGGWTWDDLQRWNLYRDLPKSKEELANLQRSILNEDWIEDRDNAIDECLSKRDKISELPKELGLLDKYVAQQEAQLVLKDIPPEPAKDFSAENGWIDPEGRFYTCGMIEHDFLAERMGKKTKDLEKTYVRVSVNPMSGYRSSLQFVGRHLTQKQKDAIWDWCQIHNEKCPDWVFGE